jgi:hypothetical protein
MSQRTHVYRSADPNLDQGLRDTMIRMNHREETAIVVLLDAQIAAGTITRKAAVKQVRTFMGMFVQRVFPVLPDYLVRLATEIAEAQSQTQTQAQTQAHESTQRAET